MLLIKSYFNTNAEGNWERGANILYTNGSHQEFSDAHGISLNELKEKLKSAREVLLSKRAKRVKPGLDDKILTSWNALMIKGLTDAYHAFGEPSFLDLAKNCSFMNWKFDNVFFEFMDRH